MIQPDRLRGDEGRERYLAIKRELIGLNGAIEHGLNRGMNHIDIAQRDRKKASLFWDLLEFDPSDVAITVYRRPGEAFHEASGNGLRMEFDSPTNEQGRFAVGTGLHVLRKDPRAGNNEVVLTRLAPYITSYDETETDYIHVKRTARELREVNDLLTAAYEQHDDAPRILALRRLQRHLVEDRLLPIIRASQKDPTSQLAREAEFSITPNYSASPSALSLRVYLPDQSPARPGVTCYSPLEHFPPASIDEIIQTVDISFDYRRGTAEKRLVFLGTEISNLDKQRKELRQQGEPVYEISERLLTLHREKEAWMGVALDYRRIGAPFIWVILYAEPTESLQSPEKKKVEVVFINPHTGKEEYSTWAYLHDVRKNYRGDRWNFLEHVFVAPDAYLPPGTEEKRKAVSLSEMGEAKDIEKYQ